MLRVESAGRFPAICTRKRVSSNSASSKDVVERVTPLRQRTPWRTASRTSVIESWPVRRQNAREVFDLAEHSAEIDAYALERQHQVGEAVPA